MVQLSAIVKIGVQIFSVQLLAAKQKNVTVCQPPPRYCLRLPSLVFSLLFSVYLISIVGEQEEFVLVVAVVVTAVGHPVECVKRTTISSMTSN